jgi:hypothetical protein
MGRRKLSQISGNHSRGNSPADRKPADGKYYGGMDMAAGGESQGQYLGISPAQRMAQGGWAGAVAEALLKSLTDPYPANVWRDGPTISQPAIAKPDLTKFLGCTIHYNQPISFKGWILSKGISTNADGVYTFAFLDSVTAKPPASLEFLAEKRACWERFDKDVRHLCSAAVLYGRMKRSGYDQSIGFLCLPESIPMIGIEKIYFNRQNMRRGEE